jgi:hypothetical protein
VRLEDGAVRTVAGTGRQLFPTAPVRDGSLSSPWAVTWWQDRVWVAMAGLHQLWTFDPRTGDCAPVAGTTHEGLLDGALPEAWFAQPSGLAAAGDRLWLVDSETSSIRYVEDGRVTTAVGTGLFDFGFRDGPARDALLQHPLGVTALGDGSVAVCDTYNGAVRRLAPVTGDGSGDGGLLTTLATGLAEPSSAVLDGEHLLVVEANAHRLTRVPVGAVAAAGGAEHRTQRPVTEVAPGPLELVVEFVPPPAQKVDDRYGPPSQLHVSATPPALLRSGEGRGTELTRALDLDAAVGDGVLHVSARAASCDEGGGEGAACHVHQQDWGVPLRVVPDGATRLSLPLSDLR